MNMENYYLISFNEAIPGTSRPPIYREVLVKAKSYQEACEKITKSLATVNTFPVKDSFINHTIE